MSTVELVRLAVAVVIAIIGSQGVGALIQWRAQSPSVRANAAKMTAETRAIEVDDQSQIIEDLRKARADDRAELDRLSGRVDAQEQRIAKLEEQNGELEQSNKSLRGALIHVTHWVQRVWTMLTPAQRQEAGDPPSTEHLINT